MWLFDFVVDSYLINMFADVRIISPSTDSITVNRGDMFTLECEGGEEAILKWRHNGNILVVRMTDL